MSERKETVNVLMAGDEGVVAGLFVTIVSLLDNCDRRRKVVLHFMNTGVSCEHCKALERLVSADSRAELRVYDVDLSPFKAANEYRGGYGAYARLLMRRYVRASRVIYVDTDFLFMRDAAELYDCEMGGHAVLATETPMIPTLADDCPFLNPEEIAGEPYFNSGIMLVDLVRWEELRCEERILSLLKTPITLEHHDQTLLNYVLRGHWGKLDSSWGLLLIHDTEHPESTNFHFGGGGVKPWKMGCHYGAVPIWWAYYDSVVRAVYRFADDDAIREHSMRLLKGAHLLARFMPTFLLKVAFGGEKALRMKRRDRTYGLVRKVADDVRRRMVRWA